MKKIINVYCITYGPHRLETEKKVISRLAEVVEKVDRNIWDIEIYICDNNSPNEFKTWLLENYNNKLNLFFSTENIGKARIVNRVHRDARPCDYVCSIDSDMLIKNDDFFEHMVYGLDAFDGKIGLVCANQDKGNIHQMAYITGELKENGHTYKTSPTGGTAGSCLMIRRHFWDAMGGYAEFDNIFGGNDGWVVMQITRNIKKLTSISVEAVCDHISDHTEQYHRWKVHQASTLKKTGKFNSNSGFYDK